MFQASKTFVKMMELARRQVLVHDFRRAPAPTHHEIRHLNQQQQQQHEQVAVHLQSAPDFRREERLEGALQQPVPEAVLAPLALD